MIITASVLTRLSPEGIIAVHVLQLSQNHIKWCLEAYHISFDLPHVSAGSQAC